MTFSESARTFALEKAAELEAESRKVGIMRSLDATRAAQWLKEIADAIRVAAGDVEPVSRPASSAKGKRNG